jgi:predicted DNA-binding transcriptional regulator AlpA
MKTETVAHADILSPRQVEAEYAIAQQTLANWRWKRTGPAFIKTSPGKGGHVKYRRSAIEAWLDEKTVPTV